MDYFRLFWKLSAKQANNAANNEERLVKVTKRRLSAFDAQVAVDNSPLVRCRARLAKPISRCRWRPTQSLALVGLVWFASVRVHSLTRRRILFSASADALDARLVVRVYHGQRDARRVFVGLFVLCFGPRSLTVANSNHQGTPLAPLPGDRRLDRRASFS